MSYAVAVVATVLVALTRGALDPWLGDQAILLPFTLAVLAAAVVGGLGPGLLAAALSMLVSSIAFFEPRGSLAVAGVSNVLHLTVFAGVSVVVCLLSHRLEQALAHAIRFERHLQRSNQRLDVAQECVDAGGHVKKRDDDVANLTTDQPASTITVATPRHTSSN